MWRSTSRTNSGSSSPSMYSDILSTTCLHRIASILSEIISQLIAQIEPRAKKACLHKLGADAEDVGCFLCRKLLNIAQGKDCSRLWIQLLDNIRQYLMQLNIQASLFRVVAPAFDLQREVAAILTLLRLIE
jgi:hypothetical protein